MSERKRETTGKYTLYAEAMKHVIFLHMRSPRLQYSGLTLCVFSLGFWVAPEENRGESFLPWIS
jgi:hypothetical protein